MNKTLFVICFCAFLSVSCSSPTEQLLSALRAAGPSALASPSVSVVASSRPSAVSEPSVFRALPSVAASTPMPSVEPSPEPIATATPTSYPTVFSSRSPFIEPTPTPIPTPSLPDGDGFVPTGDAHVERFDEATTRSTFPFKGGYSRIGSRNVRRGYDGILMEVQNLDHCLFPQTTQELFPDEMRAMCVPGNRGQYGSYKVRAASAVFLFRLSSAGRWEFDRVGPKGSDENVVTYQDAYDFKSFVQAGAMEVVYGSLGENGKPPYIEVNFEPRNYTGPTKIIDMTGFAEAVGEDGPSLLAAAGGSEFLGMCFDLSATHLYFAYEGFLFRSRIDSGVWQKLPGHLNIQHFRSVAYSSREKKLYISGNIGEESILYRVSDKYFSEE